MGLQTHEIFVSEEKAVIYHFIVTKNERFK